MNDERKRRQLTEVIYLVTQLGIHLNSCGSSSTQQYFIEVLKILTSDGGK